MEISYSFDDIEVKADEPLGSVTIADGNAQLVADTVYLDDFFSALAKAYIQSATTQESSVQLDTEPESISVERKETGLVLKYGRSEIWISSSAEFERQLRSTCDGLLRAFSEGTQGNPMFDPIRNFLAR